jgi:ABC-type antimicrobial peptide transport system permease subunit
LTVAFRNLWKYKTQSVISVIGLAVGFTCFALATLWIRYEMTYDDFHRDADRIYHVRPDVNLENYKITSDCLLASKLKEAFPEVEESCNTFLHKETLLLNENEQEVILAGADSAFMKMFDIRLIEGNLDFLVRESGKIAITEEESKRLFGEKSPLGETVKVYQENKTICAVVSGWSKHSNIYYQFLRGNKCIHSSTFVGAGDETFIKLKKNTDIPKFADKLHNYQPKKEDNPLVINSISSLRYKDSNIETEVKFQYLLFFATAGILVIICSLFNYMTLFVSRFRIRKKELALRSVLGASGKSLFSLLATEYLSILLISFLLGLLFIHIFLPAFRKLSGIDLPLSSIYCETVIYTGSIMALSLVVFFILIALFKKQTLHESINKAKKNVLRHLSIIVQLVISIGFIFCTVVMMKQIHFLHHTDLGVDFRNTAIVDIYDIPDRKILENQIKQIPGVEDATVGQSITRIGGMAFIIKEIKEFPTINASIPEEGIMFKLSSIQNKKSLEFYRLQLVSGHLIEDEDPFNQVLINEAAVKAFGWTDPCNQSFERSFLNAQWQRENVTFHVKGVLKDIYYSPTTPPVPTFFVIDNNVHLPNYSAVQVIIRYQQGQWKNVKERIEEMAKKEYPDDTLWLENADEEYEDFLKSENALMKLLGFVSMVCIIISIFGFFSLISLSCEERRKEIAIRKINGATMRDILNMYFKSYFSLLIIGAIIAFPIGYFIMKQWIEKYVKQTDISAWIYVTILLIMAFVIVLCVGWRVYKASIENPAEVIKTE